MSTYSYVDTILPGRYCAIKVSWPDAYTAAAQATRALAVEAWMHVGRALASSGDVEDRKLAGAIAAFIKEMPINQATAPRRARPEQAPKPRQIDTGPHR